MTLSRRTPLTRTPMKRGRTRVTPVNAKRRSKEWARAYGSPERVTFVQSLPCLAASPLCRGAIENAHVRTGGMSRKADAALVVPLCHAHHADLHTVGSRTFAHLYRLDLAAEAARVEAAWQSLNRNSV